MPAPARFIALFWPLLLTCTAGAKSPVTEPAELSALREALSKARETDFAAPQREALTELLVQTADEKRDDAAHLLEYKLRWIRNPDPGLLDWLDSLDSRAKLAAHPVLNRKRATLALRFADPGRARGYLQRLDLDCTATSSDTLCLPAMRQWVDTGTFDWTPPTPTLDGYRFDPRVPCGTATLESPSPIDLLALQDPELASRELIRLAWPTLARGCAIDLGVYDEIFSAAFPFERRSLAYTEALASVDVPQPKTARVFGLDLPLPAEECDFASDPNCAIGVPLSRKTARLIVSGLEQLDLDITERLGQCEEISATEQQRRAPLESRVDGLREIPQSQQLAALSQLIDEQGPALNGVLSVYTLQSLIENLPRADWPLANSIYERRLQQQADEALFVAYATHLLKIDRADAALLVLNDPRLLAPSHETLKLKARIEARLAGASPFLSHTLIERPWILSQTQLSQLMSASMDETAAPLDDPSPAQIWVGILSLSIQLVEDPEMLETYLEMAEQLAAESQEEDLGPEGAALSLEDGQLRIDQELWPLPDRICRDTACARTEPLPTEALQTLLTNTERWN
jgi:hypothetical protein